MKSLTRLSQDLRLILLFASATTLAASFVHGCGVNTSRSAAQKVSVVCATRDVRESETLSEATLVSTQVDPDKVPKHALTDISQASGRICARGLKKGQILKERDVISQGGHSITSPSVVYAAKDIPAGSRITTDALAVKEDDIDEVPEDSVSNVANVIDHYAKSDIKKDQYISRQSYWTYENAGDAVVCAARDLKKSSPLSKDDLCLKLCDPTPKELVKGGPRKDVLYYQKTPEDEALLADFVKEGLAISLKQTSLEIKKGQIVQAKDLTDKKLN